MAITTTGKSCDRMPQWSTAELVQQLGALGVAPGGVLLVHTSYRNVRPVEGGPQGLIDALRAALGPDGTLVMPSWTESDDEPFDAATTPAAGDLGVVAGTFWRLAGIARSRHPFAFAATGPMAERIVGGDLPLPPHGADSPVGRVHALDGQVLLLGVGHDANTTLHLAEVLAGVPYGVPRHCTIGERGRPVRIAYVENDHCCERFALADVWLDEAGLQRSGRIGNATARLMRSRDLVFVAMSRLRDDAMVFLHPPAAGCAQCDAARAHASGSAA